MWAIMDIRTKALSIQAAEGDKPVGYRTENIMPNPLLDTQLSSAPGWNFSQIFGKKRHFQTLTISLSTTGTILNYQNSVAETLSLFSPNFQDYFEFVRFDLKFQFEVQSHFQHQGALVVMVLPWLTGPAGSNDRMQKVPVSGITGLGLPYMVFDTPHERSILPHDFITFGHNGNYEVVLPWTCNRSMLPTKPQSTTAGIGFNSGRLMNSVINSLRIDVFDQLRAVASAVSTVSLRIMVSLENVQYSGYNPLY